MDNLGAFLPHNGDAVTLAFGPEGKKTMKNPYSKVKGVEDVGTGPEPRRRASPSRSASLGCVLHRPVVTPVPRRTVATSAVEQRLLSGLDVGHLALPRLQRRRLQRTSVRERSSHGWGPILFITSRCTVAGTSAWPPDRKTIPGIADGTLLRKQRSVRSATSCSSACRAAPLPDSTMFVLSSVPSRATRCSASCAKSARSVSDRHVVAGLDRVVAVHQHFGLDDRDDARFLRERRIARHRLRVGVDAEARRDAGPDVDHRTPLGELRAELARTRRNARAVRRDLR